VAKTVHLYRRFSILFAIECSICVLVLPTSLACADTIPVGVLSFNNLNPAGPGSPGINDFEIDNFTGLVFGLPPDFPVVDSITLTGVQISLFGSGGGSPQVFMLGDLGPGSYTPTSLQFLDTSQFTKATLQASFSQTTITLSNGTTFLADSSIINSTILPSSGSLLQPGQDFSILSISGKVNAIPEARHNAIFLAILIVGLLTLRLKHPKPISDD
jgi:hypothetical protein